MTKHFKNLFELNADQRKSFLNLKKAYNKCLKSGIWFYNNYGIIGALDSKKIADYTDTSDGGIMDIGQNSENEFRSVDSWADDTHYFHPVKK